MTRYPIALGEKDHQPMQRTTGTSFLETAPGFRTLRSRSRSGSWREGPVTFCATGQNSRWHDPELYPMVSVGVCVCVCDEDCWSWMRFQNMLQKPPTLTCSISSTTTTKTSNSRNKFQVDTNIFLTEIANCFPKFPGAPLPFSPWNTVRRLGLFSTWLRARR